MHCLYALRLQNVGSCPTHLIHLNQTARADITWWFLFVEWWNGLGPEAVLSRFHSLL